MKKLSKQAIEKELLLIVEQLLIETGEPFKKNIRLADSLQHLGIDSLGRAELFQRIEKTFVVSLPDSLLAEAETLNDIVPFLENADSTATLTKKPSHVRHDERTTFLPTAANSLIDVLLSFAEKTPDKPHIYYYNENAQEEIITYRQLLSSALKIAHSFRELGLKEGETVAIMQPTSPGFFYTFFGTLLAGGVPVPIYPPFRMHMLEAYAKQEARILQNANVRFLVTFSEAEKLSYLLKAFVPSLKHVTTVDALLKSDELQTIFKADANHFGMIQYTSGSTSDPKGVLLTHANLLANVRGYGKTIKITPDDVAVSWLPLYHDLGLIGMWLGSLYHGVPLVLLTPFSFLNHPERWLWAIHYHRGTISGAPNFAYELCIRKLEPHQLEGLDLSSWRLAANGAEKVYPNTLDAFAKKFAPYGFRRSALLPVYGLAESTVGLLISPLDREFRVDYVAREPFEEKKEALPSQDKNALSFVSCGFPIEGHEVRIVGEDNSTLGERQVGSLYFRGPSNMQGYFNNPKATQAIYHDGWFDSGDLAYMADGEVFITGRRKDVIIKAGRNIYPAEIEEMVAKVEGVRQGCVVAFGDIDEKQGTEQLIVVAETREKTNSKRETMIKNIKSLISENLDISPDHVFLVAPHVVPKTSSGKLQRAACKKMYREGNLEKLKAPPWLQLTKLSLQWFWKKSVQLFVQLFRVIYTLYVAIIFLITFTPLYFITLVSGRDVAAKATRFWANLIHRLVFCPIKIIGKENLRVNQTVIYAANHASYLDSIILLAVLPSTTRFVGKKELFTAPIIKTVVKKLAYLSVDRVDLSKGIEETGRIEAVLKAGHSVMIFPEGTFSYAPGLRPFRLGAFKTAADTNIPICPIALKGTRYLLRDDERLMLPGSVTITISEPVLAKGNEWQDITELRHVVRGKIAQSCGEAPLDLITAEHIAPKPTP